MKLEAGQSIGVQVAGDPSTMAAAIVMHVATPKDLPNLGDPSLDHKLAGAILEEAGVVTVAWISYFTAGGHEVVFVATERADGSWRDLRGTKLHIWTVSSCARA